jgi:hypothetical protein
MRELERFAASEGFNIYPVVRTSTIRMNPGRFGRTTRGMLARTINNQRAVAPWFTIHERATAGVFQLLSPRHWTGYNERINRNTINLGMSSLSVPDIGSFLYGDYGRRFQITRMDAVGYADSAMAALSDNIGLMFTNPNVYAFKFASAVGDLPFRSGGRRIVDYNIPFVQMVLSGSVIYGMTAFNEEPMAWRGFEEYLLRAVESRSGMKLILTEQNEREFYPTFTEFGFFTLSSVFFMTEYTRHWESTIGEYYRVYNDFYRQTTDAIITAHKVFERGRRVIVEYSNGVSVFINYGDDEWDIYGDAIPPLSFAVRADGNPPELAGAR